MKDIHGSFDQLPDSIKHGKLHLLNREIPIRKQVEYFKFSLRTNKKRGDTPISDEECETLCQRLDDPMESNEDKKNILAWLARSKNAKSFRFLQAYAESASEELKDWAEMALLECKIVLESEFSREPQIYVSCGLGGKGYKLRFSVMVLSNHLLPFQPYQREILEREMEFALQQVDGELEEITFDSEYAILMILLPFQTMITQVVNRAIEECNQYGDFLMKQVAISNVERFTEEHARKAIQKYENDPTSY
ncbi:MAG: hypothetical protein SPF72_07510 [Parabacteroides sp.]|nr:hypothetical protein [bacterium]MDY4551821.1 hypothetical protein [Parabacteroides sp.]MDY5638395.1 hypothetical protein [Parabacteroides sp.]